jgi:hypothetical protein
MSPPNGVATAAERAAVERAALRWWAEVSPRCRGVRSLRLEPLRPLGARTASPDRCPTGLPSTWTGALTAPDRLRDRMGEVRTPLPRINLIDALLTSVDLPEGPDEA